MVQGQANFVADMHGGRSGTIPPHWDNVPGFHDRKSLLEARRRAQRPDSTFDLDGDGFVSQSDFKASSKFDVDKDGKLLGVERENALKWQHENDPRTLFRHTIRAPNSLSASLDFENSKTRSVLLQGRREENLKSLEEKYEKWRAKRPAMVQGDTMTELEEMARARGGERGLGETWSNITKGRRERSRIEAGLLARTTEINPARGGIDPTLGYMHDPHYQSRDKLLHERRSDLVQANDNTLHATAVYFRTAQQRLKDREDALHLMRQLAPSGQSRHALLQGRREAMVAELAAAFDGKVPEHEMPAEGLDDSTRPAFWTLQQGYDPQPPDSSAKHLRESRKFWKKEEREIGEDVPTHVSVSHLVHDAQGFEPPPIQLQQFATGPQPRRAKPPQSSVIRSNTRYEDPITSPRMPNPIEERLANAPLYSSFSQDKIFNPKPVPRPPAADADGLGGGGRGGRGRRQRKKEGVVYAAPPPLMTVLATLRPYTVCSLLEGGTKVRSGGFQLAMQRE